MLEQALPVEGWRQDRPWFLGAGRQAFAVHGGSDLRNSRVILSLRRRMASTCDAKEVLQVLDLEIE